ncbi:hypothetical protein [Pantoea agglomerans]|uniref:hypothetical protein n=1 Tax=Enterobacter agglomerans TaxID=549 RepID=UPI001CC063AF|nr:hypothetical protein [Pantoea agglomerans]HBS0497634.1 hypothetical protein [Klebsiella pneumoniae]
MAQKVKKMLYCCRAARCKTIPQPSLFVRLNKFVDKTIGNSSLKIDIDAVTDAFERIYKLFRPEPRKWAVRFVITSGVTLLSTPAWGPYLDAYLKKKYDLSIIPAPTYIGWILFIVGLLILYANYKIDSKPGMTKEDSEEKKADKKSLYKLFSQLHIPSMDEFFHHGKMSMVYIPATHYADGLSALINSSNFHLYDKEILLSVNALDESLKNSFSLYGYFTETANKNLFKFDSKFRIHSDAEARKAHDDFIESVCAAEKNLKKLCYYTKSTFPDFDFSITDKNAFDDYKYHNSVPEKKISDFDFSVLSKIIQLEEWRETPTLNRLASELSTQKVDVQVALDRMINLNFAKHLYKGQPCQKYTVMKEGRAYYVENRDAYEN